MVLLARHRRRRRLLLLLTPAVAVAAVVIVLRPFGASSPSGEGVPTVPVAATPVDIGCVDESGDVNRPPQEWLSYSAEGAIAADTELSTSLRIGAFSRTALTAVADSIGPYRTTEVRDLAPSPASCVTHRVVVVEFDDGGELHVTAMHLVARASPQWIPNDARFEFDGIDTWVSDGTAARSVMVVGEDGTLVVATAYGPGARDVLDPPDGRDPSSVTASPGSTVITVEQLLPVARAAFGFSISR